MNGEMKMGYAHVSLQQEGDMEAITLHIDAKWLHRTKISMLCTGLDIGYVHKELDIYKVLNINRPKPKIKKKSSDETTPTISESDESLVLTQGNENESKS